MSGIFRMVLLTAVACFLLFLAPAGYADVEGTVRGDVDMALYRSGTGTSTTGLSDIQVTIGDTLSIDVFLRNTKQVPITQLSIYMTIDSRYFKPVAQSYYEDGNFKPFVQGEYLKQAGGATYSPVGNYSSGDKTEPNDNGITDWQIDYIESTGRVAGDVKQTSNLRYGVACTFKLVAIGLCDSSTISLDDDHYTGRFARYNVFEAKDSYYFRTFKSCTISVSGIEIDPPLNDIFMAPGTQNSTLDLDDHIGISSIPDDQFIWTATGNSNIQVVIDPVTHVVTFTAPVGFNGYEDITFRVGGGGIKGSSDTMRVYVDMPPVFISSALPDTLYVHEDSLESVLYLPQVINDPDNEFSDLDIEIISGDNISSAIVADALFIRGDENFYGDSDVTITATDPIGLSASVTIPVIVISVNDPPVISALPDVTIERNDSFLLDLAQYITDPDEDTLILSWNAPDSLLVEVSGFQAIIRGAPGYLGWGNISFTVRDPSGLSDTDDMKVTLTPAKKAPVWSKLPKIGFAQGIGSADSSLVLWNFVTDPDDADSLLTFDVTGEDNVDFVDINYRNGKLYLYDLDNQAGWDRLTITASDPDGNYSSAQTIVFVAPADGTPIVGGIPDTTLVAGTQAEWIDLDNYYFDIDHVDSQMNWTWDRTTAADSSVTIYISPSSHRVRLSSLSESLYGVNKIIFTVTDPTIKKADDICNITVVEDLTKPELYLPAKVGFVSGQSVELDIHNYVTDPMYTKEELTWNWSGNLNTSIEIDPVSSGRGTAIGLTDEAEAARKVTFTGADAWIGWERVAFTVMNPLGGAASDTLTVFSVSPDGLPLAGGLTTLSLKAGTCRNVLLDDYIYDADSPEYSITWTASGNDSIHVEINPISHIASVCAHSETWQGQETITFKAIDPDGNSTSMPVTVVVSDAVMRNVLTASLFRNPMQEDYMDIYVSSRLGITGLPKITVEAGDDTTKVTISTLSSNYFTARYLLPYSLSVGQSGNAGIIMSAMTTDGKTVQDTTRFAYGRAGVKGARLVLGDVSVTVPDHALASEAFVTLAPAAHETGASKISAGEIEISTEQYSLMPEHLMADKGIEVTCRTDAGKDGAGIYRYVGGRWVFAGSIRTRETVRGELTAGGIFALGYDRQSPRLAKTDESGDTVMLTLTEQGCGIDPQSIALSYGGRDVTYVFDESTTTLTFSCDDLIGVPGDVLRLSVADRSGNTLDTDVETTLTPRPGMIDIRQNMPNPFNPVTHIPFAISSEGLVVVQVYDLLGRKVTTLNDAVLPAGNHSILWDARDSDGNIVSSGVYLYRVIYSGVSETRKMTFIR